ncbi:unnamed protein product, partial [Bubo scandiacus]
GLSSLPHAFPIFAPSLAPSLPHPLLHPSSIPAPSLLHPLIHPSSIFAPSLLHPCLILAPSLPHPCSIPPPSLLYPCPIPVLGQVGRAAVSMSINICLPPAQCLRRHIRTARPLPPSSLHAAIAWVSHKLSAFPLLLLSPVSTAADQRRGNRGEAGAEPVSRSGAAGPHQPHPHYSLCASTASSSSSSAIHSHQHPLPRCSLGAAAPEEHLWVP